jgi:hypothetical protein
MPVTADAAMRAHIPPASPQHMKPSEFNQTHVTLLKR